MTDIQTYRIEIRFDFTGTKEEAEAAASAVASGERLVESGEVTAIFDEEWDEI